MVAVERYSSRLWGYLSRRYLELVIVLPTLISSSYLLPLSNCLLFLFQTFTLHIASRLEHLLCACAIPWAPGSEAFPRLPRILRGRGRVRNKSKTKRGNEWPTWVALFSLHFMDEETETEQGSNCPRSHSKEVAKPGFTPTQVACLRRP